KNYIDIPLAGPSSKVIKGPVLANVSLFKLVEYCLAFSRACKTAPSPPRLVVPILVLPHTTFAALLHPLLQIYMPFSNALHPSITLDPTPMQQLNFSNAQVAPSSLAVLVLLNLLQDRTERYFFLIVHFLSPWFNDFCSGVVRCSAATTAAVKLVVATSA
ncbi:hypothetical protein P692DRAFT_20885393, partial [Suillus brevipes Sb2]